MSQPIRKGRYSSRERTSIVVFAFGLLLILLIAASSALAEEKKDDTGTNPINFTYDTRFYVEMADFGDGSLVSNTYEFRAPLGRTLSNLTNQKAGIFNNLGSRFALRLKYRPHQSLNLNDPGGNPFGNTNISGGGDMDVRVLAIPHVSKKFGIATGLEAYFPTATNDLLGTGRTALVPQVFLGFFGLLGGKSIFAPGYLYVADVGGDDHRSKVNQHKIDMYFVWLLANMKHWLIINPQAAFDVENDKEIFLVDVEFGFMIPNVPGSSTYLRPGVGIGSDRPFDWTFEVGLKFIWR